MVGGAPRVGRGEQGSGAADRGQAAGGEGALLRPHAPAGTDGGDAAVEGGDLRTGPLRQQFQQRGRGAPQSQLGSSVLTVCNCYPRSSSSSVEELMGWFHR